MFHDSPPHQPPVKKRKLSDTPNGMNGVHGNPVTGMKAVAAPPGPPPPVQPVQVSNMAVSAVTVKGSFCAQPLRPSGPPPKELLDANPYGIVQSKNGQFVWCDACSSWFDFHSFNSHLLSSLVCFECAMSIITVGFVRLRNGQKHKKNINGFALRKVIKHWQSVRTKVVDDITKHS